MRQLFLVLLSAALLMPPVTPAASSPEDTLPLADIIQFWLQATAEEDLSPAARRAKYRAWNMLCFELRDVSCIGMTPPKVKTFAPNPLRPGLMGYYDGSDVIYIRNNLYGYRREEVLAHEMSHYVDQLLGLLPPMPVYGDDVEGIKGLCMSEKVAWGVSDKFHVKYRRFHLVVGESWTEWYTHCTPYKDYLYPSE